MEHSRHCRATAEVEDNCNDMLCTTLHADTMDLGTIAGFFLVSLSSATITTETINKNNFDKLKQSLTDEINFANKLVEND